jgi:hypothetical protein
MITKKEHIHTLTIKRGGEKQLFQIKLPKNAKKITGILITVQPSSNTQEPIAKNGTQLFSLEQVIL